MTLMIVVQVIVDCSACFSPGFIYQTTRPDFKSELEEIQQVRQDFKIDKKFVP